MNVRSFFNIYKYERAFIHKKKVTMNDAYTKGDQARNEILEAAKRLFLSQGYNGTSMRMIAKEAGDRAVAGIYNHFPTKQAIFEALIEKEEPYDELISALESGEGETAPEYMHSVFTKVLTLMSFRYDFMQLVQIDIREFEGQTLNKLIRETVLPRLFPLIVQLKSLPGLKPVEEVFLMRLFASMVIGFVVMERLAPPDLRGIFDIWSREEWADRITRAILYGIADEDYHT
jgi:AcrR family transcriptional regulator